MTPWQLAGTTEHSHQRALFAYLNCAAKYGFQSADTLKTYSLKERNGLDPLAVNPRPELAYVFAIPNGGLRDRITAGKLKAEGVKAGVPDIMVPVTIDGYSGLFIEMKKPSAKPKRAGAGGVAEKQSDYHKFLTDQGYKVVVCYSWLDAVLEIKEYLR